LKILCSQRGRRCTGTAAGTSSVPGDPDSSRLLYALAR
jgi:hypothetical protein